APDLTIAYSDIHGLWGGIAITLAATGSYEYLERKRGARAPEVLRGTLTSAQVRDVVRLLLETRAWEQRISQRTPVPDEVWVTLTLRSGDIETRVGEWANDLKQDDRLVRIKSLLVEFIGDP